MIWSIPAFGLDAASIRGCFFGRIGGVGEGAYHALNLGFKCGDDPDVVRRNEQKVLAAMGLDVLFLPDQVHGRDVVDVPADATLGVVRGPSADAAIVTRRGVAVGILTADCLPILIGDRAGRAVAAVHAGWRGLEGLVIDRTVSRLSAMGIAPGDLVVSIGPGIGPCHFEVAPDLAARFRDEVPGGASAVYEYGERWSIDLSLVAFRQLEMAGTERTKIKTVRRCTACEAEVFFSHRRDRGVTGRQLSAVWIP